MPVLFTPLGAIALLRRRTVPALLVCAALVAMLISFFSVEMTAVRLYWTPSSGRFLIGALALTIVLSLGACRRGSAFAASYRALLLSYPIVWSILCLRVGWGDWERRELVLFGIPLAQLVVLGRWSLRRYGRRALAPLVLAALVACSVIQLRRDQTRALALSESFAIHHSDRQWASSAAQLDDPNRPVRIAITGGEWVDSGAWFVYPFLGRRLQNRITHVPPTSDGRVAHFGPFGDLATRLDLTRWEARLRRGRLCVQLLATLGRAGLHGARARAVREAAGTSEWGLFRPQR